MTLIDYVHGRFVYGRRVRKLADRFSEILPREANVLDVGCGDGLVSHRISTLRPDLCIQGLEIQVREETLIPVARFDGKNLPFDQGSFDVVLFADVLHHVEDGVSLLRQARRVARQGVALKDHLEEGFLARQTLRFMDRVGNVRYGVPLPYRFWTRAQWSAAFDEVGLDVSYWREDLGIYLPPASWLFDRSLHFMAFLKPTS